MSNFVLGLLASLLATIIWQIIGSLSVKLKTPIDLIFNLFGYIRFKRFKNFNDAKRFIWKGITNSKKIKYISIRGFPLTQETYELRSAIVKEYKYSSHKVFQVLLNHPQLSSAKCRAKEFNEIEIEDTNTYIEQIWNSTKSINDLKNTKIPNLQMRFHNNLPIYRILIFDDFCLVGFYTEKVTGLSSINILIPKKSLFYDVYERQFDLTWQESSKINIWNDEFDGIVTLKEIVDIPKGLKDSKCMKCGSKLVGAIITVTATTDDPNILCNVCGYWRL